MKRSKVASAAAAVAAMASAVAVMAAAVAVGAAAIAVLGDLRSRRHGSARSGDRFGAALNKARHAVDWVDARRHHGTRDGA